MVKYKVGDKVEVINTKSKIMNDKKGVIKDIEWLNDKPRYITYVESMDLNLAFNEKNLRKIFSY